MASWQRKARLLIAVGATAFAVVVAFAFRTGVEPAPPEIIATDPAAVVETKGGVYIGTNKNNEDSRIYFERQLTYPDGTSRGFGVKIVRERAGKTYVIQANEGQKSTQHEMAYVVDGDVKLTVSDGLTVTADRGTYDQNTGIMDAYGQVRFSRGRMSGVSRGLTYRDSDDVVTLPADVMITVAPGDDGGAMEVRAGSAEINRTQHVIRFAGGVKTSRPSGTTQSTSAVAQLTAEEDRLETLKLQGQSRLGSTDATPGGLQSATGDDMDLTYGPDGQTLQRLQILGAANLALTGERGRAGRQITASRIDIGFSSTGATPTMLGAEGSVRVTLPAEGNAPRRTIAAQEFQARGDDTRGLTAGWFSGGVQFMEAGSGGERRATSNGLELTLGGGLNAIEEARFLGAVKFVDGTTEASATSAVYSLRNEALLLTGGGPPRVVQDRLAVEATTIDMKLASEQITATGAVKSELQPATARDRGTTTRLPSLLSDDQPVFVTAETMTYDGTSGSATYGGGVRLWQPSGDETVIKSQTLTLDEKSGNLTATGSVLTDVALEQIQEGGTKERVKTTAAADRMVYEDASRRATYTGNAKVRGSQGELSAERVDVYLLPEGRQLDRMEAEGKVDLQAEGAKAAGSHLTYLAADQSYKVVGKPAVVTDACKKGEGAVVTFFRSSDRMIIDGQEGRRATTRGTSGCQ